VDGRTRWIIGLLICVVIGLGIALIIVAGDDSNDNGGPATTANPATEKLTEPTSTKAPTTTSGTTTPNGGTPVPGGTTSSPNGEGGL
jgi:hypothetical protein